MTKIIAKIGDITEEKVDAIVNAANKSLLGGGGVDGAIHQVAGPHLLEETKKLGGAETGEAKITKGYNLSAKYVIHTIGPVWYGGDKNEPELLKSCYQNSLKLAKENNIKTISFPAISAGVYGYPKDKAAEVAISTVKEFIDKENYFDEIRFILFDEENWQIYKGKLEKYNL